MSRATRKVNQETMKVASMKVTGIGFLVHIRENQMHSHTPKILTQVNIFDQKLRKIYKRKMIAHLHI